MKILIVDDRHTLSDLLAQFLGQKYQVVIKSNGLEAIQWLQKGDIPDLIITDLEMPELDGYELISKVRSSGYFSEIPIMVLSCRDSSPDRIRCLKLGANDFMIKPFNPEELSIRIDNLLQRRAAT